MDRNIRRMARFFADGATRLRPHFKAHKTPEIAKRQLAAGSVSGVTCATVAEAEVAAALSDDILIANEVVLPEQCRRLAALSERASVTVAVDSQLGLDRLASAARDGRTTIGVLVDVDVGQGRCGVRPGAEALGLAEHIERTAGVTLRGVMGYEGHLQPLADRSERETRARAAMAHLVETAQLFRARGLPCEVVSGGGTGTYDISGRVPGVTEIQAGSYVLMDSDYGRLDLPFEQALFVLGTVISRPSTERCVADCGHKACSKDHGLPSVEGFEGAAVASLNDEHAVISLPPDSSLAVGDRIKLRPSHIDPTINLHDAIYALDGDTVADVWPVTARGYADERTALR